MYRLAAWPVLAVHTTWVVFLVAGFPLGRQSRAVRLLHLAGSIFTMALETFALPCPLTLLEKSLTSRF